MEVSPAGGRLRYSACYGVFPAAAPFVSLTHPCLEDPSTCLKTPETVPKTSPRIVRKQQPDSRVAPRFVSAQLANRDGLMSRLAMTNASVESLFVQNRYTRGYTREGFERTCKSPLFDGLGAPVGALSARDRSRVTRMEVLWSRRLVRVCRRPGATLRDRLPLDQDTALMEEGVRGCAPRSSRASGRSSVGAPVRARHAHCRRACHK
jgi:hypothetical protein